MIVLALDTSTRVTSVALRTPSETFVRAEETPPAETILGLVDALLGEARLGRDAIELVVVGTGPGLFTGTRVGVATAKGLAMALDRPLLGVSSLDAVIAAAKADAAIVDAGRGEAYAKRRGETAFLAAPADALAKLGERCVASASLGLDVPPAPGPDVAWLAEEGARRLAAGEPDARTTLEPDYVRPSDAQLPKTPLRT